MKYAHIKSSRRIREGLYYVTDTKNRLWIVEHRLDDHGFWWCGTEDDPSADQYCSKWECLEAISVFNKQGY